MWGRQMDERKHGHRERKTDNNRKEETNQTWRNQNGVFWFWWRTLSFMPSTLHMNHGEENQP